MNLSSRKNKDHVAQLASAMRAIRLERRMRPGEVARAMGLPLRTYERLEAGVGPFTFERILAFADATNSDAFALLAVLPLGLPDFALWCADNKLMMILVMTLGELAAELGPDITYLQSRTIIGAYTRSTRELVEHFRNRDLFAEQWLDSHKDRVTSTAVTLPHKLRLRGAD